MKKRLLALILCIATIVSFAVPSTFASGETIGAQLFLDGAAVSEASFPVNEKLTLAVGSGSDGANQWQMFIPAIGAWVNIQGETGVACNVSYAMISNALDGNGQARIRASVNTGSGLVYSNEVVITPERAVLPSSEGGLLMMAPPTVLKQATVNNSNTGSTLTPEEEEALWAEAERTETAMYAAMEASAAADAALAEAQANYDAAAAAVANHPAALAAQAQADYDAAAAALEAANTAAAEAGDLATAQAAYDAAALALEAAVAAEAENVEQLQAEFDAAAASVAAIQAAADAAAQAQADYDAAALALEAANAAAAEAGDGSAEQAALDAAAVELESAKTAAAEAEAAEAAAVAEYEAADAKLNEMLNASEAAAAMNSFALESDTPEVLAPCTVVIEYKFSKDGSQAANPWTGTVTAGSTLTGSISSPVIVGYTPDQATVSLDGLGEINQDTTVTVFYNAAEVDYTVKHFKQNVGDDNYTIDTSLDATYTNKKGLTESVIPDNLAVSYDGFYSLPYDTSVTIAADGSTEVEIYYDRYYYLMNFNLGGGYGTEPVYARYGADIGEIITPTKAGYTFKGWTLNGTDTVTPYSTMPAQNITYTALWKASDEAKVTVVFWGENANDEEYSHIKSSEVYVAPGTEYTYMKCSENEHSHSDDCYTNCTYSHIHNRNCYNNVGDATTNTITNYNGNLVDGTVGYRDYNSYIYIAGTWYRYYNQYAYYYYDAGTPVQPNCSYSHTHTDACLGCGKTEHIHDSECYAFNAGISSDEYYFVSSETVTVAADGSSVVNVYYDRVQYSVKFYTDNNLTSEYTQYRITAKWGANILNQWPTHNGSSSWYVPNKDNTWQNSIQIMPVGGTNFYGPKTGSNSYTAYYYVEALPGDSNTFVYNGVTYKLHHSDTSSSSGNVTDEERYGIEGFTYKEGTANGTSYNNAKFYYTRNTYKLIFNDGYNDVKTESVKFEAPLSTYSEYVPSVPSAYEPGSVVFGGWYLNPECTGDAYVLNERTMPAANVLLYAKWVPVTRTVEFYLDENALANDTKIGDTHPDLKVPHGSIVKEENRPSVPENGSYSFVGWFYKDENGVEKAFDFANMPIRRDMKVYGKWSSKVLVEYTIKYAVKDADGNDVYIADDTTGKALGASTKTFDAKTGEQLIEGYQEGYFPTTNSHSITMDVADPSKNVFTFYYVEKTELPYKVMYLESDGDYIYNGTETVLAPEKNEVTRKAIETETFVPVKGYMPDAYQKRLVLSANEKENVIIFWYTKDTEHAPVQVIHYVQNVDGETYTVFTQHTDLNGVIGQEYSTGILTINAYEFYRATSSDSSDPENKTELKVEGNQVTATVSPNGLLLELYYNRIEYPYEYKFLEQGTNEVLADSVIEQARYGSQVSVDAKTIPGYELVSKTPQVIVIQKEEKDETGNYVVTNNLRVYYYVKNITINYVAVGPEGVTDFGNVSPESESLGPNTGTAQGSTPTAAPGFKFVGWYKDEACNIPVDEGTVGEGNKFVPAKVNNVNVAATYYAKFEYNLTSLTITKSVANPIAGETFIFTVSGPGINTKIVLTAGESITIKDLPFGVYTVTEDTNWSWRYTPDGGASKTITLSKDSVAKGGESVLFENSRTNNNWLSGDCYAVNTGGKGITSEANS